MNVKLNYKLQPTDLCLIEHKDIIMSREGMELRKIYLQSDRTIPRYLTMLYPWVTQLKHRTRFGDFLLLGETVESAKRLAAMANYLYPIVTPNHKEFKEFTVVYADDFRIVQDEIKAEKIPWFSQINPKFKQNAGLNIYTQIAELLRQKIITIQDLEKLYGNMRFFTIPHKRFNIFVINDYVFFLAK